MHQSNKAKATQLEGNMLERFLVGKICFVGLSPVEDKLVQIVV